MTEHDTPRSRELKRIKELSNDELLTETLQAQAGDDWDGFFTPFGRFSCDALEKELRERLKDWLTP